MHAEGAYGRLRAFCASEAIVRGTVASGLERRSGTRVSRRGREPASQKFLCDGTRIICDRALHFQHKPSHRHPSYLQYNTAMQILAFDADATVRSVFDVALSGHEIIYFDTPIRMESLAANPNADIVSIFVSSKLTKEHIDALPRLSCIIARSTGIDHIDTAYAKEKGIEVKNVAKYGAHTVAEFTFALLLTLTRRIFDAFRQVREEGNFKTGQLEGFDLYGKTIGVVGTGAIGRNVVSIARGFGMQVRMFDLYPDQTLEGADAHYVALNELLAQSDIVSLHVPYTKENHHLLSAEQFMLMKDGVIIVNTARGELIDTDALLSAIVGKKVAGAGLDVLEEERTLKDEIELVKGLESIHSLKTLIRDHALIDMPRVIITPHIAFFSKEAYQEILAVSAKNILEAADRITRP